MASPNIIYILADDLGYGDLSCYGAEKINTPNCDRLAETGMTLTDAHATSAVCTPSRYSILTGRYNWRSELKSGVLWGHSKPLIEKDILTVPKFLKEHGYVTSCIGKWHLGLDWALKNGEVDYGQPIKSGPNDVGFDYFFGISASLDMPPYCFIENDRTVGIPSVEKDNQDFSQKNREGFMVPGWKDEEVNQKLTEKALNQIEHHVSDQPDDPFFMYFPLTGPHTPWKPAKQFEGKSAIGKRGDMVLELDWTVGEVLNKLEDLNIRENTIVVLTSDNGPHPNPDEITIHGHTPSGILRGQKADIWEGGHRVPFLASWPTIIPENTVSDDLFCLVDLLGTCAGILEEPLPERSGEDSIDISPVWTKRGAVRDAVVHHSITGMFAIRNQDWKLIQGKGSGGFEEPNMENPPIGHPEQGVCEVDESPGQLYNLKKDVKEKENVYLKEPQVAMELTKKLIDIINNGDRSI